MGKRDPLIQNIKKELDQLGDSKTTLEEGVLFVRMNIHVAVEFNKELNGKIRLERVGRKYEDDSADYKVRSHKDLSVLPRLLQGYRAKYHYGNTKDKD